MLTPALLEQVQGAVLAHTGLRVREADLPLLSEQGQRLWRRSGMEPVAWLDYLHSAAGRADCEILAQSVVNNETYFFRDAGQFRLLRQQVLPECRATRGADVPLWLWSAGCSSGEEAWSLAMAAREAGVGEVTVLGTDIDPRAIARARRGVYSDWSLRGLDEERRRRFFLTRDEGHEVLPELRARVRFDVANLLSGPPAGVGDVDVIFCRNVFIYMPGETSRRVASMLVSALRPGGWLFTGHGELIAWRDPAVEAVITPDSVLYRRRSAPAARTVQPVEAPAGVVSRPRAAPAPPSAAPSRPGRIAAAESAVERDARELARARQLADRGLSGEAGRICQRVLDRQPLVADAWYLLALLAQEAGDEVTARAHLRRVVYIDPSHAAGWLAMEALHRGTPGETAAADRARRQARQALERLPPERPLSVGSAITVAEALAGLAPDAHGSGD